VVVVVVVIVLKVVAVRPSNASHRERAPRKLLPPKAWRAFRTAAIPSIVTYRHSAAFLDTHKQEQ